MTQISIEKLSPVVVECSIEVPVDRVKSEVDKAYAQLQKSARVRGYRPGKAPRHVIAHLYAPRVHADVAKRLVDDTLDRALAEKSVQPLSKPSIAQTELTLDAPFTYKARFEVRPEVTDVKWEGLAVKRPRIKVEDAAVSAEIERLRREHSTLSTPEPERPSKLGDVVLVTFTLEIDGKTHASGEQSLSFELGSGETMKEIEAALIGASAGEKKVVEIDFPAAHPAADLKGKRGSFHIELKEIKERVLPDVDDEFAKDCGEYADLAALKAKLVEDQEKALKQKQGEAVAEQLVLALCSQNEIPVPPSLVQQQAAMTERELNAGRRAGQRLDSAEVRARILLDSEQKVRAGLLMAEIARIKEVKVDGDDLEKGYAELAEQTGKNVAKLKAEYRDPKKREMLVAMILEDKILDLLEAAAKIEDVDSL